VPENCRRKRLRALQRRCPHRRLHRVSPRGEQSMPATRCSAQKEGAPSVPWQRLAPQSTEQSQTHSHHCAAGAARALSWLRCLHPSVSVLHAMYIQTGVTPPVLWMSPGGLSPRCSTHCWCLSYCWCSSHCCGAHDGARQSLPEAGQSPRSAVMVLAFGKGHELRVLTESTAP